MCVQSRRVQVCTCRNARRLIETPRTFKLRKFTNKFVRRALFLPRPSLPSSLLPLPSPFFPPSDLPNELERIHRRPLFSRVGKSLINGFLPFPYRGLSSNFSSFARSGQSRRGCNDNSPREIASFPGSLSISPSIRFHLKGRPCSHKEET